MDPAQDLGATVRSIIDANRYMILATADADGQPWASPVFYGARDYTDFFWLSVPEAVHSRNVAARPQLSMVVFDSQVVPGSGQAVYMSAVAQQVPEDDLDESLRYYPGDPSRGARQVPVEQVRPPAPFRLYRAAVSQRWILCPRTWGQPCAPHGIAHDHRTEVPL